MWCGWLIFEVGDGMFVSMEVSRDEDELLDWVRVLGGWIFVEVVCEFEVLFLFDLCWVKGFVG